MSSTHFIHGGNRAILPPWAHNRRTAEASRRIGAAAELAARREVTGEPIAPVRYADPPTSAIDQLTLACGPTTSSSTTTTPNGSPFHHPKTPPPREDRDEDAEPPN